MCALPAVNPRKHKLHHLSTSVADLRAVTADGISMRPLKPPPPSNCMGYAVLRVQAGAK